MNLENFFALHSVPEPFKQFLTLFSQFSPKQRENTFSGCKKIFSLEHGKRKKEWEKEVKQTVKEIIKGKYKLKKPVQEKMKKKR